MLIPLIHFENNLGIKSKYTIRKKNIKLKREANNVDWKMGDRGAHDDDATWVQNQHGSKNVSE